MLLAYAISYITLLPYCLRYILPYFRQITPYRHAERQRAYTAPPLACRLFRCHWPDDRRESILYFLHNRAIDAITSHSHTGCQASCRAV